MRCETARTILELNLPRLGEADWRDIDAVEEHLKACAHCQAWWTDRAREDIHLAHAFCAVQVPQGLATSIANRLPAIPKKPRFATWVPCLVAASVLFLGGLGFFFWPSPQSLDPEALAALLETSPGGDGPTSHERMEQLIHSFARLGMTVRLPESLNYHQVVTHGITELQGRQVPQVLFQSEENGIRSLVKLLVLDSRQFDLSQYSVEQNAATNRQMELVPDSGDNRFFFLLSTQEMGRAPKY